MKIDHLATMRGCSSAMSDVGPKGTFDAVAAQRRMGKAGVWLAHFALYRVDQATQIISSRLMA